MELHFRRQIAVEFAAYPQIAEFFEEFMQHLSLRLLKHHLDGADEGSKLGRFLLQLFPAGFGQGVELCCTIRLRKTPFSLNPPLN